MNATSRSPLPAPPVDPGGEPGPWRAALLYAGPLALLLLVAVVLPLARGRETLFLRDVMNVHLEMRWAQVESLREGAFPLLDPFRAGGQPLAGNLNASPFYPDTLLFLVASPFWAMNARFWIHLLLAPPAFYALGRAWGLGRPASWAAAACYTLSGFFLSHLSFYNLIPGAALAPALVAACLAFARPGPPGSRRRRWLAAGVALLWALLLLGGDPLMALLAFFLAATALAAVWRERVGGWRGSGPALARLAAGFAAGTALAAPQLGELLRILPVSFRGFRGYSPMTATISSWHPAQALEWLVPFVFGRLDLLENGSFWGNRFFTGHPPYYLSLYPGLLALGLVFAAGRPRSRAAGWGWAVAAIGLFFALGRYNPLTWALFEAVGRAAFRYPVKSWLLVAVGGALLCGLGFDRLLAGDAAARRRLVRAFLVLALLFLALWAALSFAPLPLDLFTRLSDPPRPAAFWLNERLRWAGLCLLSLAALAALGLALWVGRRRPRAGGALLLAVHAGAQLFFLAPAYPMDAVTPYLIPPPALDHLPPGVTVVNPDLNYLFGPSTLRQGVLPEPELRWVMRRAAYELYPFTGPMWGRRYELNVGPEGLDSFLTRYAQNVVKHAPSDPVRVRLLAAWGVGRLVMNHPLEGRPEGVRLLARIPSFGLELFVYELARRSPPAFLARRVYREEDLGAVAGRLADPAFDPRSDAAVLGEGAPRELSGGTVRFLRSDPEDLLLEVDAGPGGGLLVVQQARVLQRAEIDGRPARVVTANLHRLGVEVPEGKHRVRLWISRERLWWTAAVAVLGLLGLPVLVGWGTNGNGSRRDWRPSGRPLNFPSLAAQGCDAAEPDDPRLHGRRRPNQ
jgi:hypothetical protein